MYTSWQILIKIALISCSGLCVYKAYWVFAVFFSGIMYTSCDKTSNHIIQNLTNNTTEVEHFLSKERDWMLIDMMIQRKRWEKYKLNR